MNRDTLTKSFNADISFAPGERAVVATISTAAVDSDGDVLIPAGMNSKRWEKNPVVMYSHNYQMLPVGRVASLKRSEKAIVAKMVFASRPATHPAEQEWLPDTLYSLYREGVLSAFSVGFHTIESRHPTKSDIDKFGPSVKKVISKWEVLEVSACSIPANPEAVAIAVNKGGISAETARKFFGDNCPSLTPPTPKPVTYVTHAIETEAVKAEPRTVVHPIKQTEPPSIKHIHYILPRPKGPSIEKRVQNRIDKLRGRIYKD